MGKRTNTAVWLENQARWQIKVQKDGKRRTFTSSTPGRKGQREANAKADEWLDNGIEKDNMRVSEAYNAFVENIKLRTSRANYALVKNFGDVHLIPAIGHKKLNRIKEPDLQAIIDKAYSSRTPPLSRKTLRNYLSHITAFFKYCRMMKWSTLNPEFLTIPSGARYKGKKILQPNDLLTLFSTDETTYKGNPCNDEYIHAYRFAVLTGMRPGEVRGLKWTDIDGSTVTVNRSINVSNELTAGKNQNAIRSFEMSALASAVIDQQRQATGKAEYVFPISTSASFYHRWSLYCEVNNIPHVSLYELRHTFVSVVKQLPEGRIRPLVGHSKTMDTTGTYSHELQGEKVQLAADVNQLFTAILNAQNKSGL